jgi:hypothetical protein
MVLLRLVFGIISLKSSIRAGLTASIADNLDVVVIVNLNGRNRVMELVLSGDLILSLWLNHLLVCAWSKMKLPLIYYTLLI